ncbi:MAG: ABC transporter permease subunit, partial [Kordiimonadaceae bacterium]|nr:ABC transporter permease subunit [Kordiimonadaceae bacterium]
FLLIIICASPFGLFLYAFIKILSDSFSTISVSSFDYISLSDLGFSIAISLISTICSVIIGSLISFHLLNSGKASFKYGILNIVMVIPHLAFAYIIYLFFSDTGFLYRLFGIENGIALINDTKGIGIILNYIFKEVPFVILYLMATNKDQMQGHIFAAKDLGANFIETFCKIYLPLNALQIMSISIVIFAFVLGNYEVPFLLGANAPQFLSVSALADFQSIDFDQNIASYLKVIIIFFVTFLMSIAFRLYVRRL